MVKLNQAKIIMAKLYYWSAKEKEYWKINKKKKNLNKLSKL
jgi:hypothetical protein